jgi:hypothetical protein
MSVRVEWAQVDALGVVVVDEVEDAFGQRLRAGWVALLLGRTRSWRSRARRWRSCGSVAARILQACTDFEAGDRS